MFCTSGSYFARSVLFSNRDEGLQAHIEFLEGLGIAGVSHHDLLFTKEAEPLPPPGLEDQDLNASWEPR